MLAKKDETVVEIGKRLRRQGEDITREPLPSHWVDLIHHLDEQEQKGSPRQAKGATEQCSTKQAHVGPGLAGAELALTRQEEVLRELLLTGEPTEKAKALLKELRRRAAQALKRH
jgi:hypothetical protein